MMDIKLVETSRCDCGGQLEYKSETGYISARELGRPGGAKGGDTWVVWYECDNCHTTRGELHLIPEPCHICKGEPAQQYDMCQFSELVTGMYEWVPGIDNSVNLCLNPACFQALEKKVARIMSETFFE